MDIYLPGLGIPSPGHWESGLRQWKPGDGAVACSLSALHQSTCVVVERSWCPENGERGIVGRPLPSRGVAALHQIIRHVEEWVVSALS